MKDQDKRKEQLVNELAEMRQRVAELEALKVLQMSPSGVSILYPSHRAVVFRLAGQACAFPLERVQEVLPMAALLRPPGLPLAGQASERQEPGEGFEGSAEPAKLKSLPEFQRQ